MDALAEYQNKRYFLLALFLFYRKLKLIETRMLLFFSQQKIFIEYIMLDGVNDEEQHAHLLGKLLETFEVVSSRNINVHIFLI